MTSSSNPVDQQSTHVFDTIEFNLNAAGTALENLRPADITAQDQHWEQRWRYRQNSTATSFKDPPVRAVANPVLKYHVFNAQGELSHTARRARKVRQTELLLDTNPNPDALRVRGDRGSSNIVQWRIQDSEYQKLFPASVYSAFWSNGALNKDLCRTYLAAQWVGLRVYLPDCAFFIKDVGVSPENQQKLTNSATNFTVTKGTTSWGTVQGTKSIDLRWNAVGFAMQCNVDAPGLNTRTPMAFGYKLAFNHH